MFFRFAVHFRQTAREHRAYALLQTVVGRSASSSRNRKHLIARGSGDFFAQPCLIFSCSCLGWLGNHSGPLRA